MVKLNYKKSMTIAQLRVQVKEKEILDAKSKRQSNVRCVNIMGQVLPSFIPIFCSVLGVDFPFSQFTCSGRVLNPITQILPKA